MLDDINAQDAACKATVERAQDKLQRLNLDAEVAKHPTALDELQRKASALRQVCTQTCSSHYEQIATSD
jgi:urocanate hydratase